MCTYKFDFLDFGPASFTIHGMLHVKVFAMDTHMVFPSLYVCNLCLSVEEFTSMLEENFECGTKWQCTILRMLHIRFFAM
jgi:hypothetical protein